MAIIREQIIDAIVDVLDADYGVSQVDERQLPITIVDDGADEITETGYDEWLCEMPIAVGSAAETRTSDPKKMRRAAHDLLNNIVSAMYRDETLGGLIDSVTMTGSSIEAEAGRYVFAEAVFSVSYRTQRGDLSTN